MTDVDQLIINIEKAFQPFGMPSSHVILDSSASDSECAGLQSDLEVFRGREVTGEVIRSIHQRMLCLSAEAWLWVMPHYLMYCISPEGQYNRFETEFLIYTLSPSKELTTVVKDRFVFFDALKLQVVEQLLVHLSEQPWWQDYCPSDLNEAISFLRSLIRERTC